MTLVKLLRAFVCLSFLCVAVTAFGQAGSGRQFIKKATTEPEPTTPTDETTHTGFPWEFDTEFSIIGGSDVARGYRTVDDIVEVYTQARVIYTPRIKYGILRLGVAYERFGFSTALASGFSSPYAGEHFMALALKRPLPSQSGVVVHAAAFAALE